MNIVIPAAGMGQRFKDKGFALPKPLIDVNGEPMLVAAINSLHLEGNYFIILQKDKFLDELTIRLNEALPNVTIIPIDFYTRGAACSVLLAKDYINNNDELIVVNCDQIMHWNSKTVLSDLREYDAGVVTITDNSPKHSYVEVNTDGLAVNIVEKKVISNNALTGIHYWKHGSDFVTSAEKTISHDTNAKEHYVSTTYNELIKSGKRVGIYMLDRDEIDFIGTPEDLSIYESRKIKRLHTRMDNRRLQTESIGN